MPEQAEEGLIYYLQVMWKWKGVILGGTLLLTAVALVVHFLTPKTYAVSRILKIGKLMEKPLESREATIDRISDERLLQQVISSLNLNIAPAELTRQIAIDQKINPNIRYMVQAFSPELALKIAEAISDRIVETHQQILHDGLTAARKYIADQQQQIRDVEAEISKLRGVLTDLILKPQFDERVPAFLGTYLSAVERLSTLKKSLRDELIALSSLGSASTMVIASGVESATPVSPKISTAAQVVGLGLFLLILLVFFLDRLEKRRGRAH